MTISYKWSFPSVVFDERADQSKTIRRIEYRITGTDGVNSIARSGTVFLDPPGTADDFVPYDQLTNAVVVGWIEERFPELVKAHVGNIANELMAAAVSRGVSPHFASDA